MRKPILILFLFCSVALLYADKPDLGTKEQKADGKKLYLKYCEQCHGKKGDGKGVAALVFKPAPRDFSNSGFKIRTTESGDLPMTKDIIRVIKKGIPYTGMPPFKKVLNDQQIENLAYYIKTFKEDFTDEEVVPKPLTFPDPPPYSEESAKKGRKVFEENKCIDCHGEVGRGDGKSAPTFKEKDEQGNSIKPADMTKRWTFRGGSSRKDIYRTFMTGMDGTPMPSYADSIKGKQRWQLVDYVYSLSKPYSQFISEKGKVVYSDIIIAIEGDINLSKGESLFKNAPRAFLPVIGQIIEPGREFYPSANAVEVKAIYNKQDIAIMLSWHDMERTNGSNSLSIKVPASKPGQETNNKDKKSDEKPDQESSFSDAVAIQIPSQAPEGFKKPYFIFGDSKRSVDLWFVDLAKANEAKLFIGKGSDNIKLGKDNNISAVSKYKNGRWSVIFKRRRKLEKGIFFEEKSFVPIAFSIWDGFNKERGNKHGLTSWYHIYLKPHESLATSIWPMAKGGGATLVLMLLFIILIRRKYKNT